MNKDIIYEFRNIVEESRTEDRQDYYIKLRNTLDLLEELEEKVESQDKTIDKLVEEQEEREKYVHSLEEENAKLRIDNTEKLCEECSELAKEAGITEEDTSKILKDYRDKVENSIPVSELKNDLKYMKNAKATGVKQLLMKKGIIGYLEKLLEERE